MCQTADIEVNLFSVLGYFVFFYFALFYFKYSFNFFV